MKAILSIIFMTLVFCFSQQNKMTLPIIPQPASVEITAGQFILSEKTVIVVSQNFLQDEAAQFNNHLSNYFGMKLKVVSEKPAGKSFIEFAQANMDAASGEGYKMNISAKSISIYGDGEAGVFYGMQSLIQLLPIEKSKEIKIQCCAIADYPQYKWRGMHLDVCRHFFTKDEVKKYLDYLALYKFNTFHWHLTEDQGWRIEIKKYPKLTEIGSQRKETVIGKQSDTAKFDGKPYGGFYTQEDVKEIIAYAEAKHITVIPEIEMPGHSLAALSAYPQFSCTGGPFTPATIWGVFEDVYCAGNDSTFDFLENILSEVCGLFPGKYIHIGGDECPKERWKKCVKCQKRMKDENLKDEHELQSYFISRIEKFLNAKGKQIIGWDEILEGGLAPNAAVMSWRGTDGGIAAAKQKHFVVMTPGKPCYFDHYQAKDRSKEPLAIGGYNPLENVYAYEPTPAELAADETKYIMGAQGNVWTEYIPVFSQVEYMSVPRMCALAEVLWTSPAKKNYADFTSRLIIHTGLLNRMGVNYCKDFLK